MQNIKKIKEYLSGKDDENLFAEASRLRREIFAEEVYLRGIIEFSNYCKQNCMYCGLRAFNKDAKRYRLTQEEILECVNIVLQNDIPTVVLQAGEDNFYSPEWIAELVKKIKDKGGALTLSLGERDYKTYKLWREAGADRYLLRIETFDMNIYRNARPGKIWKDRYKCIDMLRELGYEVGSGIMIGMPGETLDSLANSIYQLTKMHLHMIGMGPFVSHPQTPYKDEPNGNILWALRTIALVRILNPDANMPATSALNSVEKNARIKALQYGANVVMPSLTPARVKELYNIYPGKNISGQSNESAIESMKNMILEAGYKCSTARGDSPRFLSEKKK